MPLASSKRKVDDSRNFALRSKEIFLIVSIAGTLHKQCDQISRTLHKQCDQISPLWHYYQPFLATFECLLVFGKILTYSNVHWKMFEDIFQNFIIANGQ